MHHLAVNDNVVVGLNNPMIVVVARRNHEPHKRGAQRGKPGSSGSVLIALSPFTTCLMIKRLAGREACLVSRSVGEFEVGRAANRPSGHQSIASITSGSIVTVGLESSANRNVRTHVR